MSGIDNAIVLNNEGVSLLISGQDRAAIVLFTEALMIVRTELRQIEKNIVMTVPSGACAAAMDINRSELKESSAIGGALPAVLHKVSPLPNLEDECFFIYNQALTIILPSAHYHFHSQNVNAACIVLNLALAYHRRGKQGYPVALKKAQVMYEMSMQLVGSDTRVWNNCATPALVYMAAVNNSSQIHLEQGDIQRAREGVSHLSYIIRYSGIHPGVLSDDEATSFLINCMIVAPFQSAPAA
jgi:hypothetical protein